MVFVALDPFVESRVDAFEATIISSPQADLRQFLPVPEHEKYLSVLLELLRVDLDLAWSRGERRSAFDYQATFPLPFRQIEFRQQLAFEEYRLRCQAGENPDPDDFRAQFAIDTSDWLGGQGYDTEILSSDDTHVVSGQSDASHEPPIVGKSWNGFRIVEPLGSGSFGSTFLARQSALANREVVLKFSRLNHQEAWRLAQLQHTYIVPVLSVHEHGTSCAICMPYLGRQTLADRIQQDSRRSRPSENPTAHIEQTLTLAMRLADALDHSHRRGVLHRDVKPANILVSESGEPLLFDFNLAVDQDSRPGDQVVGGTLAYMAPEQLQLWQGDEVDVDHRADIYSLGVVVYQLITGRLPWQAKSHSDVQTVLRARSQPIPVASSVNPAATPAVDSMLAMCLQVDPNARYQSAADLRDDIRRHLEHLPLACANNTSFRELCSKWMHRHPRVVSGSSIGLLAAILGIAILTGWLVREAKLRPIEAAHTLHEFSSNWDQLRASFVAFGNSAPLADSVIDRTEEMAARYHLHEPIKTQRQLNLLKPEDQVTWRENASSLAYLLSDALYLKSRRESAGLGRDVLSRSLQYNQLASELSRDLFIDDAIQTQKARILATQRRWNNDKSITESPFKVGNAADRESSETHQPLGDTWIDNVVRGLQARDDHDLRAAEKRFRRATLLKPTDATAWLLLANALRELRQFESSIAAYDIAGSLSTDLTSVGFQRGLCRLAQGRFDQAIQEFTDFLTAHPEFNTARLNRALAHMGLKEYNLALDDLNAVIDQGSRETRAYFLRSQVHQKLGDFAAAQTDWETGIERTPQDAVGWIARGIAQMKTNPQAALADLASAIAIDPMDNTARHNQAHIHSEILGNPRRAIDVLSQCLQIDPNDSFALAGRGVLLARDGQAALAVQDAARLLEMPLDATTRYQVACIYALCVPTDASLSDKAIQILATSLREDPAIEDFLDTDPDISSVRESAHFVRLKAAIATFRESESNSGNVASEGVHLD